MSKEPIITDQTFTYIINAADTPLEGRLDRFFNSERWILTDGFIFAFTYETI